MIKALTISILRILVILIASLMIMEAALRLFGFSLAKIQHYKNSAKVQQTGTYRILCLGESTTEGQYPPYLESILNAKSPKTRFTVIDKGLAGTNASEILAQLDGDIAAYRPHMVVTMIGINDMGHDYVVLESTGRPSPVRRLANRSKLFRLFKICRSMLRHRTARSKVALSAETRPLSDDYKGVFKPAYDHSSPSMMGPYASLSVEDLHSIVKTDEKNALALAVLARKLALQGRFPEANSRALQAYRLDPQDPGTCCLLAQVFHLYQFKHRDKIEKLMTRVLKEHPDNLNACLQLGESYLFCKQYDKAEKVFSSFLERGKANNTLYLNLSDAYIQQGKYAEAEKLLRDMLRLESPLDLVYGNLALVYLKSGDYRRADRYFSLANDIRMHHARPEAAETYAAIARKVISHDITLVCMQYPMRSVRPLKKMIGLSSFPEGSVIFVDNERLFKDAVRAKGYDHYFVDQFGGDFGHCNDHGNTLLARHLADVILDTLRLKKY